MGPATCQQSRSANPAIRISESADRQSIGMPLFVASRARVSDVVCSFGSTLELAKDRWELSNRNRSNDLDEIWPPCKVGYSFGTVHRWWMANPLKSCDSVVLTGHP